MDVQSSPHFKRDRGDFGMEARTRSRRRGKEPDSAREHLSFDLIGL